MSGPQLFSLVLPCRNQADHIEEILGRYIKALEVLPCAFELLVVPNACTDATVAAVERLAAADPRVKAIPLAQGGWGRAVRAGLAAASGDLVGYTNTARTEPESVPELVSKCIEGGSCVVKATRHSRQAPLRSIGSRLYNFEAKLLFGVSTWDVNGTPKVFPREVYEAVNLTAPGDMIDLELMAQVARKRVRVIEVPVGGFKRHGGKSSTTLKSAWGMYAGAAKMWWAGPTPARRVAA